MKSTGIVRKIDNLGRFVVPAELRRNLKIENRVPGKSDGTSLEIYTQSESIIIEVAAEKIKGVTREVDILGRFVIPKETRKTFGIEPDDSLEIFTDENKIILKKYWPECIFCGEVMDTIRFKNKTICTDCLRKLKNV